MQHAYWDFYMSIICAQSMFDQPNLLNEWHEVINECMRITYWHKEPHFDGVYPISPDTFECETEKPNAHVRQELLASFGGFPIEGYVASNWMTESNPPKFTKPYF